MGIIQYYNGCSTCTFRTEPEVPFTALKFMDVGFLELGCKLGCKMLVLLHSVERKILDQNNTNYSKYEK